MSIPMRTDWQAQVCVDTNWIDPFIRQTPMVYYTLGACFLVQCMTGDPMERSRISSWRAT